MSKSPACFVLLVVLACLSLHDVDGQNTVCEDNSTICADYEFCDRVPYVCVQAPCPEDYQYFCRDNCDIMRCPEDCKQGKCVPRVKVCEDNSTICADYEFCDRVPYVCVQAPCPEDYQYFCRDNCDIMRCPEDCKEGKCVPRVKVCEDNSTVCADYEFCYKVPYNCVKAPCPEEYLYSCRDNCDRMRCRENCKQGTCIPRVKEC